MEDLKKLSKEFAKTMEKMIQGSTEILQKVREQEPEKVDQIIRDQQKTMKAIKNRDFDALQKLRTRYANYSKD
tara:strand:+ start:866 stop:1084 length:219 start_codon:yes stop_codon:yes gene_type:complete